MTSRHSSWARRGRRFLITTPGLIAPAVLLVLSTRSYDQESAHYYSLSLAQRLADGDPFPANAGMLFASVGVAIGLLLFVPPLLVGLPARLRLWAAIVGIVSLLLPLWVAFSFATDASIWALVALLSFAYTPILAVTRLIVQSRRAAVPGPQPGGSS
jgi:hypothetical protein